MSGDEALNEIKSCLLAGTLELTGEWGELKWSGFARTWERIGEEEGLCFLYRYNVVPYITDALERMLTKQKCRVCTYENVTQVTANRGMGITLASNKDKLAALWEAWKRLDKEQKQ